MTALTGPRSVRQFGDSAVPSLNSYGVLADAVLYQGALLVKDKDGYVKPVPSTPDPEDDRGIVVVGIFDERSSIDNTGGASGAVTARVRQGCFGFVNSASTDALTIADLGQNVYAVDDQTVARTSNLGKRPAAGVLVGFDGTLAVVMVGALMSEQPFELMVLAGADLRTKQFLFMKLDSNSKAVVCGAGEAGFAILQNAPNTNEVAILRYHGASRVVTASTDAAGTLVASDANGKAKAAVTGKTDTSDAGAAADPLIGSHVLARLLEVGIADTPRACFIEKLGAIPTTAA